MKNLFYLLIFLFLQSTLLQAQYFFKPNTETYELTKLNETENVGHQILADFQKQYYGTDMLWYEPKQSKNSYFHYKGIVKNTKEVKELYILWQSYADGLEWRFKFIEFVRTPKANNKWRVIKNKKLAKDIKEQVGKAKNIDVFIYQYGDFSTEQKYKDLNFQDRVKEIYYGVYADGKLYFFDEGANQQSHNVVLP